MNQFASIVSFPLSVVFRSAEKVNINKGLRVATKAKKGQEKADFAPYVAELPVLESAQGFDPVIRSALEAGFATILDAVVKSDESFSKFKSANGADVIFEIGEVEFTKAAEMLLSLDRATGRKLTQDEIKAALRALRDGFYKMVADKKNCAVSELEDSIVRRLQVDLMRIETAMIAYAASAFRPATPEEAERHIKMLDAIGSAAQVLNKEAGECWSLIQSRITRYLESIAAADADDEESALF